ncbi:MAG: sulfotransferase [Chloroflexota bacterium]
MTDLSSQPVFVVGGPRSGTTLLSAMLAAHSAFECGPETHFLSRWSHLPRSERDLILDPSDWPERATAYVCSLSLGKQPIYPMYGLEREEIRAWLAVRPPSLATMLESLTAQRALRAGALRWVEKTPRHLEVPELITEAWPGAHIVRIVRDPRDAAVSLTKVPFGTPSLLTNLSVLARMNEAAADFYRSSDVALTVRYEDLVSAPERELRRICTFVGVDYEPGMLKDRSGATGVAAQHEWWKGDATGPLDPSRSGRWSDEMPPEVQHYAALNLGSMLEEHGYGEAVPPKKALAIVPAGDALNARYDEVLLRLATADVAIRRPIPSSIEQLHLQEPLVFFGVVGQLDPDRRRSAERRVIDIARLGWLLLTRRLQGRPVVWVRRLSLIRRHPRDGGERFIARMLQVLASTAEAEDLPALVGAEPAAVESTEAGSKVEPAEAGSAQASPAAPAAADPAEAPPAAADPADD